MAAELIDYSYENISAAARSNNYLAPAILKRSTYERVQEAMLTPGVCSFAEQMANANRVQAGAMLVTAVSAIPVADSIRGFYAEAGGSTPVIDYIKPIKDSHPMPTVMRKAEKLRLMNLLAGTDQPVYVIDEFVASGRTLKNCLGMLGAIGIDRPRGIAGKWYRDIHRADVDIDQCTSIYADFMFQVGVLACQQSEL
jgi:hypothetical protein